MLRSCGCGRCLPCLSRSFRAHVARAALALADPSKVSTPTRAMAAPRPAHPPLELAAGQRTQGAQGLAFPGVAGVPREPTRRCVRPLRRSLLRLHRRPTPRLFRCQVIGLDASSRTAHPRPPAPRALASMPMAEGRGSARTMTASSRRRTLSQRPTAPSTRALSMPTSATLGRSSNARRSTQRVRGRTPSRLAGNAASSPPSVASPRSLACRMMQELMVPASLILETRNVRDASPMSLGAMMVTRLHGEAPMTPACLAARPMWRPSAVANAAGTDRLIVAALAVCSPFASG
jgi:hypothetical protein